MTNSQTGDSSPRVDPAKGWERYLTSRTQDGVTATVNVGVLSDLIHSAITTLEAENARLRAVVDAETAEINRISNRLAKPGREAEAICEAAHLDLLDVMFRLRPAALDQGEG